jgi:Abnormal spindle-like microcephaly-assoc'd, ASPM-SPD-2-Hydin
VSNNRKCLALSMIAITCGLAMTASLAYGQQAKTTVIYPSAHATSQHLRELPIDVLGVRDEEVERPRPIPMSSHRTATGVTQADPVAQTEVRPLVSASKGVNFDGIGSQGFAPSDVNLAIGPNHIVQTVNVQLAVFNKSGALLSGPTNLTTLFAPLAGDCAAGASDPIVNYDRLADRWVISDIGIAVGGASFSECVAVSKTNDPTGAYTLYAYSFGTNVNDYPKLGVWPTANNSAYLASYNMFADGVAFSGANLCGFDRTKMLAGNPTAAQLCVLTPNTEGGYLPADLDGPTPPANGPGLFLTWQNNNPGQLFLRKLSLNFATNSVGLSNPTAINVANSNLACGNGGTCVPQKGTTQTLDTLGDRLMYRMAFRKFADHERVVVNHAVANGSQVAFRWYEILDPSGAVTVNQQGTFAPDTTFRWMASAAMDKANDIAIGYSASSATINPAIRFTGRVPGDPAGTLQTEASMLEGTGSQTAGLSRWGDYTALQVDPSDDCTFWYTNQYQKVNGTFNWSSHIGSFVFSNCGGGGTPAVTLSATKLSFPKTVIGVTSKPKSVTLSNTGTATLNISSITASGDFAISNKTCGATVSAGTSCAVSVTFKPTAKGARQGNLTFTDNALTSPQIVALAGTGTTIKLTPSSLTFGTVAVGNSSPPQTITVTNVSAATVTFTSIGVAGLNPADFPITSTTCGPALAGGASCTLGMTFKPTATGTRKATLKLFDDGGGSPQTLMLKGTGA